MHAEAKRVWERMIREALSAIGWNLYLDGRRLDILLIC